MTTQTMIECQVLFENPQIPNAVLLTEWEGEPKEQQTFQEALAGLRKLHEESLGALKDEQVFYRVFTRTIEDE